MSAERPKGTAAGLPTTELEELEERGSELELLEELDTELAELDASGHGFRGRAAARMEAARSLVEGGVKRTDYPEAARAAGLELRFATVAALLAVASELAAIKLELRSAAMYENDSPEDPSGT